MVYQISLPNDRFVDRLVKSVTQANARQNQTMGGDKGGKGGGFRERSPNRRDGWADDGPSAFFGKGQNGNANLSNVDLGVGRAPKRNETWGRDTNNSQWGGTHAFSFCYDYQRGQCQRGDACKFVHDEKGGGGKSSKGDGKGSKDGGKGKGMGGGMAGAKGGPIGPDGNPRHIRYDDRPRAWDQVNLESAYFKEGGPRHDDGPAVPQPKEAPKKDGTRVSRVHLIARDDAGDEVVSHDYEFTHLKSEHFSLTIGEIRHTLAEKLEVLPEAMGYQVDMSQTTESEDHAQFEDFEDETKDVRELLLNTGRAKRDYKLEVKIYNRTVNKDRENYRLGTRCGVAFNKTMIDQELDSAFLNEEDEKNGSLLQQMVKKLTEERKQDFDGGEELEWEELARIEALLDSCNALIASPKFEKVNSKDEHGYFTLTSYLQAMRTPFVGDTSEFREKHQSFVERIFNHDSTSRRHLEQGFFWAVNHLPKCSGVMSALVVKMCQQEPAEDVFDFEPGAASKLSSKSKEDVLNDVISWLCDDRRWAVQLTPGIAYTGDAIATGLKFWTVSSERTLKMIENLYMVLQVPGIFDILDLTKQNPLGTVAQIWCAAQENFNGETKSKQKSDKLTRQFLGKLLRCTGHLIRMWRMSQTIRIDVFWDTPCTEFASGYIDEKMDEDADILRDDDEDGMCLDTGGRGGTMCEPTQENRVPEGETVREFLDDMDFTLDDESYEWPLIAKHFDEIRRPREGTSMRLMDLAQKLETYDQEMDIVPVGAMGDDYHTSIYGHLAAPRQLTKTMHGRYEY